MCQCIYSYGHFHRSVSIAHASLNFLNFHFDNLIFLHTSTEKINEPSDARSLLKKQFTAISLEFKSSETVRSTRKKYSAELNEEIRNSDAMKP